MHAQIHTEIDIKSQRLTDIEQHLIQIDRYKYIVVDKYADAIYCNKNVDDCINLKLTTFYLKSFFFSGKDKDQFHLQTFSDELCKKTKKVNQQTKVRTYSGYNSQFCDCREEDLLRLNLGIFFNSYRESEQR